MAQISSLKLRRKVFLIKGFSENEIELNNDRKYIGYYKSFFQSNAGGAYDENEIDILEDSSTEDLKLKTQKDTFDYVIIVLLGHGATQGDYQLFKLNESEIIKPGQLYIDSSKLLIILESCRSLLSDMPTVDLSDKIPDYKEGGILRFPITRQKARAKYDKQINECKDGLVVCFACSKDETANDYMFSNYLIKYAFNWHLHWMNCDKTLNIRQLIENISPCLSKTDEKQNPEIVGDVDFPFAICKF